MYRNILPSIEKYRQEEWELRGFSDFIECLKNHPDDPFWIYFRNIILLLSEEKNNLNISEKGAFPVVLSCHTLMLSCHFSLKTQEVFILSLGAKQERALSAFVQSLPEYTLKQGPDYVSFKELVSFVTKVQSEVLKHKWTDWERVSLLSQREKYWPSSWQKDLEEGLKSQAEHLLNGLKNYSPGMLEIVTDWLLNLTTQYFLLRLYLLRFIALLPSLAHDKLGQSVKRGLLEALQKILEKDLEQQEKTQTLPWALKMAIKVSLLGAKITPSPLLAKIVRWSVQLVAKRFIAAETVEQLGKAFIEIEKTGRSFTLDQLGELVVSEAEAEEYAQQVLKILDSLKNYVPVGKKNQAGIYLAHVSIKVSALCSDFKVEDREYTYSKVAPRLRRILQKAQKEKVFLNIDAEHILLRDLVFWIYKRVLLESPELHSYDQTGIVVQAYLKSAFEHLKEIIEFAQKRQVPLVIRLVKGAYWDAETIEAQAKNIPVFQFLNKEETDLNFRFLISVIFSSFPHVQLCLASHNYADHAYAIELRKQKFPNLPPIEHQCLHQTFAALSLTLARQGHCVRDYVPIGNLIMGMAYLVRRILENSSQVGILGQMRQLKKGIIEESPEIRHEKLKRKISFETEFSLLEKGRDLSFFSSSVPLLSSSDIFQAYEKILQQQEFDFILELQKKKEQESSLLPLPEEIEKTLVEAMEKEPFCLPENFTYRSLCLLKAYRYISIQKPQWVRLIMEESKKTLKEAIGDVDEALDFLLYYALGEFHLQHSRSLYPSFLSSFERPLFSPVGPVAVIAPWNFPLAIPCGMTAGALVAGNVVVLKPSEHTPLIAQKFCEVLWESGVPQSCLKIFIGRREKASYFVSSEKFKLCVFTGSLRVGEMIFYQKWKQKNKAIAEMGGKNALVITQTADIDEAIMAILDSAFNHAGQKCSACSRVLVHESLKEKLLSRLSVAMKDLPVGLPKILSTRINPLISEGQKEKTLKAVKEATEEAHAYGGKVWANFAEESFYPPCAVGPVLIELTNSCLKRPDSFFFQELFAPVVHALSFKTLEEAIKQFNASSYGLTGGIISQSEEEIEFLVPRLECGNLYVNRAITAARVGVEPFGGFKLSGTGPKAGGESYLQHFHSPLPFQYTFKATEYLQREKIFSPSSSSISFVVERHKHCWRALPLGQVLLLANLLESLLQELPLILSKMKKGIKTHSLPGQENKLIYTQKISSAAFIFSPDERAEDFQDWELLLFLALALELNIPVECLEVPSYLDFTPLKEHYTETPFLEKKFVEWKTSLAYRDIREWYTRQWFISPNLEDTLENSYIHEIGPAYKNQGVVGLPRIMDSHLLGAKSQALEYLMPFFIEKLVAINCLKHGAIFHVE